MKYLVTGGAGFIGSHLVEKLVDNNNEIIIIDDLSSGYKSNIIDNNNITFIKNKVQNINNISQINGIFHLAAQASVPLSIDNLYKSSANNLLSSLKVFEWAKKQKIPIVYASSSAIYGNINKGSDILEKYEILSPYAQDKLTLEHYANLCNKIYDTPSMGLRFFNVYGPKQDPSSPYSGVISIFIDRLLKNKNVTVNGGFQTRDFVYVKDVVDVMIKSMDLLQKNNINNNINVGTGRSITINYLLETIAKILQVKPEIRYQKLPKSDPKKSDGIYDKLNRILHIDCSNFELLENGIKYTIDYIKNEKTERI